VKPVSYTSFAVLLHFMATSPVVASDPDEKTKRSTKRLPKHFRNILFPFPLESFWVSGYPPKLKIIYWFYPFKTLSFTPFKKIFFNLNKT
jgi:hypothetical protein